MDSPLYPIESSHRLHLFRERSTSRLNTAAKNYLKKKAVLNIHFIFHGYGIPALFT